MAAVRTGRDGTIISEIRSGKMKDGNMALAQEIKEIIDNGVLHAYTTVNAIAALT